MHEYELLIETINPCGGEAHAKKEFKEVFAESPESYVAQNGRYPVIDSGKRRGRQRHHNRRRQGHSHPLYVYRVIPNRRKKSVPASRPERIFLWNGIIHGLVLFHIFLQLFKKAFLFGLGILAAVL